MDSKRKRKPREFTGIARNDIRLKKLVEILCKKLSFLGEGVPVKERYIDLACKIYPEHKNNKEIDSKIRFLQAVFNENYKYAGETFDVKSINVLAVVAGYKSWRDYLIMNGLNSELMQTSCFYDDRVLNDIEVDLDLGAIIYVGWTNSRYLKLKYKGGCEFDVLESVPDVYTTEDIIEARWFEVGLEEKPEGYGQLARIYAVLGDEKVMLKI